MRAKDIKKKILTNITKIEERRVRRVRFFVHTGLSRYTYAIYTRGRVQLLEGARNFHVEAVKLTARLATMRPYLIAYKTWDFFFAPRWGARMASGVYGALDVLS